ncbi:MAG: M20/M25/M40 family metallo-hydrolase [Fuerstiella sp.]
MSFVRILLPCFAAAALISNQATAADSVAEVTKRVGDDIKYLASDELQGRGVETAGIELAAQHILTEYEKYGLKPGMPDGTFRQTFDITVGDLKINDATKVVFTNASGVQKSLAIEKQFQPLQRGKNGSCSGELFFIGYGIASDEDSYNEYAGMDVEGKILVMLRREPQQADVNGGFKGTETTAHSYIDTKLSLAIKNKAAGVIFVNDTQSVPTAEQDDLSDPSSFGTVGAGIPFVHVKQSVVNELLSGSPLTVTGVDGTPQTLTNLKSVCEFIDGSLKPVSQAMTGNKAEVNTDFSASSVVATNLIGVIEGEGELANETIVVGGHYDHLGYGGYGSRAQNRKGEIHNGADDNATGTAAVMEMVRRVATGPKPKRRIVFICFSGEERGLLGSKYYVSNPVFPLENTVAMLNYDMIGTLRNNKIEVNGVGTAAEFANIVAAADTVSPLDITIVEHPFAGSDHLPFFQKEIPVMFCFTGVTPRYHTPDDDFETINVEGVVSVIDFTESLLRGIDALPAAPEFKNVVRGSRRRPTQVPYLGVAPNMGVDADQPGIPLQVIRPDSPAEKSGLKVGDVITAANGKDVDGFSDLVTILQSLKPGAKLNLKVTRGEETLELTATLASPQ